MWMLSDAGNEHDGWMIVAATPTRPTTQRVDGRPPVPAATPLEPTLSITSRVFLPAAGSPQPVLNRQLSSPRELVEPLVASEAFNFCTSGSFNITGGNNSYAPKNSQRTGVPQLWSFLALAAANPHPFF